MNFRDISLLNFKQNTYKLNFCSNFRSTVANNPIDYLAHKTCFFREPITDEFVQKYIMEHFSNKDKVFIVSAGCSSGEEARSYSVMLDEIKDKLFVLGFDEEQSVVNQANFGEYDMDDEYFMRPSYLFENETYRQKCVRQFQKYFRPVDQTEKKYELRNDIKQPYVAFLREKVENTEKLFGGNKIADVFLLRNVMYHLLCSRADNDEFKLLSYSEDIAKYIFTQINHVLNDGGLLVFSEGDFLKPEERSLIYRTMIQCGFEPVLFDKYTKEEIKTDFPEAMISKIHIYRKKGMCKNP